MNPLHPKVAARIPSEFHALLGGDNLPDLSDNVQLFRKLDTWVKSNRKLHHISINRLVDFELSQQFFDAVKKLSLIRDHSVHLRDAKPDAQGKPSAATATTPPADPLNRSADDDAAMLACRVAPSWPAFAAKITPSPHPGSSQQRPGQEGLGRVEAREGVVQTWYEFFDRVGDGPADPAGVLAAVQFWRQWPRLYWLCQPIIRRSKASEKAAERLGKRLATRTFWPVLLHTKAEQIILQAAERAGLDGSSIALSSEHCRNIIHDCPEVGAFGNWPECLKFAAKFGPRIALSNQALAEIAEARRTVIRLEARLAGPRAQGTTDGQMSDSGKEAKPTSERVATGATGMVPPASPPTGGKGPATDAGNVSTAHQNAQSAGNVHGAVGPRLNQTRLTKDEANIKAREYLRKHPKAKARELASGIGCSVGLVPELTAWKAVQEERKKRQQKAPKAVALTDKVTATRADATKTPAEIVAQDEILRTLLAQAKDSKERERIESMSPEKREELFEAMKDQLSDAQADGLTAAPDAGGAKTKPRFRPRRKV